MKSKNLTEAMSEPPALGMPVSLNKLSPASKNIIETDGWMPRLLLPCHACGKERFA